MRISFLVIIFVGLLARAMCQDSRSMPLFTTETDIGDHSDELYIASEIEGIQMDAIGPNRDELITFFQKYNGEHWTVSTNWLNKDQDTCTWFGVICNSDNSEVIELKLDANNLVGSYYFPYGLTFLTKLDLSENNLTGKIGNVSTKVTHLNLSKNKFDPAELNGTLFLGSMENLNLSHSNLISTIPDNKEQITYSRLRKLNLSYNNLEGTIPSSFALTGTGFNDDTHFFTDFDVSNNQFDNMQWESLSKLTHLKSLNLSNNKLVASSSELISNLLSSLEKVCLTGNSIQDIPRMFRKC